MLKEQREVPIHLNQDFYLFNPSSEITRRQKTTKATVSNIPRVRLLGLEQINLPNLSFNINTIRDVGTVLFKKNTITPFARELGYPEITDEDLQAHTRIEKLDRLEKELNKPIPQKHSNQLRISLNNSDELTEKGLITIEDTGSLIIPSFSLEFCQQIKRLRLQVTFPPLEDPRYPRITFQAYPDSLPLYLLAELHYINFFPIATGPLPIDYSSTINSKNIFLSNGFYIGLPNSRKDLGKIIGKFVFDPLNTARSSTPPELTTDNRPNHILDILKGTYRAKK